MPQLDNVRHEIFCKSLARGTAQADAYAEAGFNRSSANASTLARKPFIKERIDELIKERLQREGKEDFSMDERKNEAHVMIDGTGTVSKEWILKELVENIAMARDAGQYAASNKGLELLGKEIGLFQDKPAGSAETEAQKVADAEKAKRVIPIDSVNKLLGSLGFDGQIDLKTLKPIKTTGKRLSVDKVDAS